MERLTRQKGPDGKELTPCSLCYMADLPICKKNSGECWELAMYERLAAYEDTGHEPDAIPAAIQEAAKASEHNTARIMAEVIAGAMKDTIDKYCTPPVSSTL